MKQVDSFSEDKKPTTVEGMIRDFCKRAGVEFDKDFIQYTDSSTMTLTRCQTVLEALMLMAVQSTTDFNTILEVCSVNTNLQWIENGKTYILVVDDIKDEYTSHERALSLSRMEVWGLH